VIIEELVDGDEKSNGSNFIEIMDDESHNSMLSQNTKRNKKRDGLAGIEARMKRLEEREYKNSQMLLGVN
jgi:hypothetical protein